MLSFACSMHTKENKADSEDVTGPLINFAKLDCAQLNKKFFINNYIPISGNNLFLIQ